MRNCYAHTPVHSPMSTSSCQAGFCEALVPAHPSGVCAPLYFAVFVHALVPVHALSCAFCHLLLSTSVWISHVSCSAILRFSMVSGLSPSLPSLETSTVTAVPQKVLNPLKRFFIIFFFQRNYTTKININYYNLS